MIIPTLIGVPWIGFARLPLQRQQVEQWPRLWQEMKVWLDPFALLCYHVVLVKQGFTGQPHSLNIQFLHVCDSVCIQSPILCPVSRPDPSGTVTCCGQAWP